jgi:hypothetical protein
MSQTKAQLIGAVGLSTFSDLSVSGGVNATGVVTATSFVGPLTGTATGLSGTPNVTVGVVTATSVSVSGNVSIAGTLTYEDVTNVDSVGIITARSGVQVTGGSVVVGSAVTLSSGGINVAGVVTSTSFSGSGASLTTLNASNLSSGTVPDARFPATLPTASGANLTSLNASNISSGTVATARLASGTANNTTYLRGDQTWASITSGITITDDTSTNAQRYLTFTSSTSGTISGENVSSSKLTYNPSLGVLSVNRVDLILNIGTMLKQPVAGGLLICKSGGVGLVVSPYSAEVSRTWYSRDDAATRSQEVTGCTGWFVPTCGQLQIGYACRAFWDQNSPSRYWSSTELNGTYAWQVLFYNAFTCFRGKNGTYCTRAFRCVTY